LLKVSKNISSNSKIYIVKDNSEYLKLFHFLKLFFNNYLIIRWTCVEMAKVLRYSNKARVCVCPWALEWLGVFSFYPSR
jgi:hypothetical protein